MVIIREEISWRLFPFHRVDLKGNLLPPSPTPFFLIRRNNILMVNVTRVLMKLMNCGGSEGH